jgi:DNA-binding transcriptional ArsR family regulator
VVNKQTNSNRRSQITAIFAALTDATRRRILVRLSDGGEGTRNFLAKPFQISLPAISRHLRVLQEARLIELRRQGRVHLIRARAAGLREAQRWMAQCAAHWDARFDALEELLKTEQRKESKR